MNQQDLINTLQNGIIISDIPGTMGEELDLNQVKYLYDEWRGNRLVVKRNWGDTASETENITYSPSACFLRQDYIQLKVKEKTETLTIATWNVNSIRIRLPLLLSWLKSQKPDVVCLQETKVEDHQFPEQELRNAGYDSVFYGQKGFNGVAILSRLPIDDVQYGFQSGFDPDHKRLLKVRVEGINIINIYVPQGQTTDSPKFEYKLEFLDCLFKELTNTFNPSDKIVLLGDINIAPDDRDIVSPETMRDMVSFHPLEHKFLKRLKDWGLTDIFRTFHGEDKLYSWWDFRTRGFEKNEGMRIDHIWTSDSISQQTESCEIDINNRSQPKPSDHAPVICKVKL